MKQQKIPMPVLLIALLLAFGTLACAQEPSKTDLEADAKADAETQATADATSADHTADTAPHHAEPSAADWKTKLQVKMALLEKLGTDSLHVDVTSNAGAVRLSGTVEKRETMELAETMTKSVAGVTGVRNDIRLEANVDNTNKAGVAAGEAEAELKDALLSTKVRLVLVDGFGSDGFRIGTEVANGVVTLEFGPDMTAARRDEAIKATQGVEGVTKVVSIDKA